jgi:hypothetical protein
MDPLTQKQKDFISDLHKLLKLHDADIGMGTEQRIWIRAGDSELVFFNHLPWRVVSVSNLIPGGAQ